MRRQLEEIIVFDILQHQCQFIDGCDDGGDLNDGDEFLHVDCVGGYRQLAALEL
jgi:hypothetical protein